MDDLAIINSLKGNCIGDSGFGALGLNSSKGAYRGLYGRVSYGAIKGDARSLDYSSCRGFSDGAYCSFRFRLGSGLSCISLFIFFSYLRGTINPRPRQASRATTSTGRKATFHSSTAPAPFVR